MRPISSGYGVMVPRYSQPRVVEILGLIAVSLARRADEVGYADLVEVISEVVTPLRAKEHLPKDVTFNNRMRWHPVYRDLKRQKKVRGGKR